MEPLASLADRRARKAGLAVRGRTHRLQVALHFLKFVLADLRRPAGGARGGRASVPVGAYAPGVTPWTSTASSPAPTARSSSSRAVKQVVQRSNGCFVAVGTTHRGHLVQHAGGRVVVLPRFQVAHGEGGRERAHRERTAGAQGARRSGRTRRSRRVRRAGRSRPGTGRSWRRTRRAGRARARRAPRRSRRGRRRPPLRGQTDELGAVVDADHLEAPPGQRERVTAGSAPDVEHPHPRLQPERVDEEVDLLLRPLRERVAQVRGPEEVGDRVEPIPLGDRRRHVGAHPSIRSRCKLRRFGGLWHTPAKCSRGTCGRSALDSASSRQSLVRFSRLHRQPSALVLRSARATAMRAVESS